MDNLHTSAVRFLLEHVARHGDSVASSQAQKHIDAIEKAEPSKPLPKPTADPSKPDSARSVADGEMNAGSSVLTSATAKFSRDDVGKKVAVSGVGPGGNPLNSSIKEYTSPTQVTLAHNASATVTGRSVNIED